METTTIKVYQPDKDWIAEKAEREGVTQAEVFAEAIEEYADAEHHHRCPSCDGRFTLDEVDMSTVREAGMVTTDVRYFLRGKSQVKDFECPCCDDRLTPDEAEIGQPVSTDDLSDEDSDVDTDEDSAEGE